MEKPYVVFVGNKNVGKSFLFEKISGFENLSSDSCKEMWLRSSTCYPSFNNQLLVGDTPGKLLVDEPCQNISFQIDLAYAMILRPVSRIVLVVKAKKKIEDTIAEVRQHVTEMVRFKDFFCVCVTHMDLVEWNTNIFANYLKKYFRISHVVFSGRYTNGDVLTSKFVEISKNSLQLILTNDNVGKYFDLSDVDIAVIKSVKKELENMLKMQNEFFETFDRISYGEIDIFFKSFQTQAREQIIEAQKSVCYSYNFTFEGNEEAKEKKHLVNMTSQSKGVFSDVRKLYWRYKKCLMTAYRNANQINSNVKLSDLMNISDQQMINDNIIKIFQDMIKMKFAAEGLQDPILGETSSFRVLHNGPIIQVLNDGSNHWVTISTYGCKRGEVCLLDSRFRNAIEVKVQQQICSILHFPGDTFVIHVLPVQQQQNKVDCGLFALAFAYYIASFKTQPIGVFFDNKKLREHMLYCLKQNELTLFPMITSERVQGRNVCPKRKFTVPVYSDKDEFVII